MNHMSKHYQTRLFKIFTSLQKDLKDSKITDEQFNKLFGFLLEVETNRLVDHEMKHLLPDDFNDEQCLTVLSYKRKTKFNHV